jgi:hypothetical protein
VRRSSAAPALVEDAKAEIVALATTGENASNAVAIAVEPAAQRALMTVMAPANAGVLELETVLPILFIGRHNNDK